MAVHNAVAARRVRSCKTLSAARAAVETLEGRTFFSTTLGATADAAVRRLTRDSTVADANFGADAALAVTNLNGSDSQSFLRFDISGLSGVGQAYLRLHGGQTTSAAEATLIGAFRLDDNWVEGDGVAGGALNLDDNPPGEVRWNNQPSSSGGAIDSAHVQAGGDYLIDVTAAVQAARAQGAGVVSFALRNVGGNGGEVVFSSRETSGGLGPKLIVEENANGPSGQFNVPLIDADAATDVIRVTYTDTDDIDASTIDVNDIEVIHPGGDAPAVQGVAIDSTDPKRVLVTYTLAGPGGSWDRADNGVYGVVVRPDAVRDAAGNAATGGPNEFFVDIPETPPTPPADSTAPSAALFRPIDITTAGGASQTIVATLSDDVAVSAASVRDVDLVVTSANGSTPLTVTDVSLAPSGNAAMIIATFTVAAPGGSWDSADNGDYNVVLLAGSISDAAGNVTASAVTSGFSVNIAPSTPPSNDNDSVAPKASIDNDFANITTPGGTTQIIKVRFQDNKGIDLSSVDSGDLIVARPGSAALAVTNVTLDPSRNGKRVEATFTLAAPGGTWDADDNGTYQIQVRDGAAADTSGNRSAQVLGTFEVNVPSTPVPPADTTGPTATVAASAPLTTGGGTEREIKVTYADDTGVATASINSADVTIARAGGSALSVVNVSFSPATGGKTVTATYVVAAPGGEWDAADNGVYTITVKPGQVLDIAGNASTGASGQFEIALPTPPPTVDPNFGGGQVSSGFVAEAATALGDGKVLVVGRMGDLATGTSRSVLARLNADGSLDTTFQGGRIVGPEGLNEAFYALTLAGDGSILVAGTQNGNFVTARFKSTGALDAKFGERGRAVADFGFDDAAFAVAIAPDGSIIAAGGSNGSFAFAKYTSSGAADLFFGDKGRALFALGSGGNIAAGVTAQSDGKIVATGPSGDDVTVVRLNANGSEDLSFGSGGALTLSNFAGKSPDGGADRSIGVALQRDQSILVNNRNAAGDFIVARVRSDGKLDTTFGNSGIATIDFGGDDDADAILVQGSGEIFAVGTTDAGGKPQTAVAALSRDGRLDTQFGSGGKLTIDANVTSTTRELHVGDLVLKAFASVAPDGRLVIGASDQAARASTSSTLRRLNVPGSGLLGRFGVVPGSRKAQKLMFTDADNTVVTITLKGGYGQAFYDGSNLDLVLSGVSAGALSIKTKGGDGRLTLRNVMIDGTLKSFAGTAVDLAGVFSVAGAIGKATFGGVSGMLAAAGAIASVSLNGNLTGQIYSGANLGSDGQRGGTGSAADAFSAGRITKFSVRGSVSGATVAAGLDPVDDRFLNDDDRIVDPATSVIGSVAVKGGTDASTRFVAGQFGKSVKLPEKVTPVAGGDPRFLALQ